MGFDASALRGGLEAWRKLVGAGLVPAPSAAATASAAPTPPP